MASVGTVWSIIEVVLGFGLLIFVHELGHFLAAKLVGVRVERFSLGFPPKLLGVRWGETEYCLSAIPLGGYVKMAGESVYEDAAGSPAKNEFRAKTPGQRALVILAGPVMNVAFAFPAAALVYILGIYQPSTLCEVRENTPAYEAGLRSGDRILEVNGEPVFSFHDIRTRMLLSPKDSQSRVTYLRDESIHSTNVRRRGQEMDVGLVPYQGTTVSDVDPGSPAADAGIQRNDRITAVNGEPVTQWTALRMFERQSPGQPAELTIQRPVPSRNVYPRYETVVVKTTLLRRSLQSLGIEYSLVSLPVIGNVRRGFPAEEAGLQEGDRILRIGEHPIRLFTDLQRVVNPSAGKSLHFVIWRNGQVIERDITPREDRGDGVIGIESRQVAAQIDRVLGEGTAAGEAGIRPEDLILSVDGKDFRKLRSSGFHELVQESQGQPLKLEILRHGASGTPEFLAVETRPQPIEVGYLGVQPGNETVLRRYAIGPALIEAVRDSRDVLDDTVQSIYRLIVGDISRQHISGVVGITTVLYHKAREGVSDFLHLLFVISINLALINLFPIPILDGGHLLMLLFEKVRGRPVREQTLAVLQYVGLALLVFLVLFATRNDIRNFF